MYLATAETARPITEKEKQTAQALLAKARPAQKWAVSVDRYFYFPGDGVTALEAGQHVTIQPNFSCGQCALCTSGHSNICASKTRLGFDTNGVFAEFVKVPACCVWKTPAPIPDEVAVFTEPLSVGVHAVRITAPNPRDKELVIRGSLIYTNEFPEALKILKKGQGQTGPLATGRVSLAELDQVLRKVASPERIKTLVEI